MSKQKLTTPFIKNISVPVKRIEISDILTNGLSLRVTSSGSRSFVFRYRFGDKVKRYTIGKFPAVSLAKAREEARELSYKVSKGIDPMAEKKEKKKVSKKVTFRELASDFKRIHLQSLRPKTKAEHKRIIDNELMPKLGHIPAGQLEKEIIINLLDNKAITEGKATMANRIRARLHSIYEFGNHRGLVTINPVSGIKSYPEGETKRDRFYSEKEIHKIWHVLDKVDDPAASVIKMLLIAGQRKTETMNMKWSDISNDVWTIPAELAKGKRRHDVPLSSLALEIINKRRSISENVTYVFNSPVLDDAPVTDIKRTVKKIRESTEITDFRLHDLRRTAATYMAKLKVDRTILGKILNHKGLAGDGQVTAIYDRYDYLDEKKAALEAWSNELQSMLK